MLERLCTVKRKQTIQSEADSDKKLINLLAKERHGSKDNIRRIPKASLSFVFTPKDHFLLP